MYLIQTFYLLYVFFFQAEDGIRDAQESRGLGDVYKRQINIASATMRISSAMVIGMATVQTHFRGSEGIVRHSVPTPSIPLGHAKQLLTPTSQYEVDPQSVCTLLQMNGFVEDTLLRNPLRRSL
eukprot:TRINITY_DN55561_c0_g1_i1.p2 TRINITY_DN55561_c0_g1~~TRINITY_DN55561_c0_g1_i1.p2  ORF type:complete len:124 (-),score=11.26 TRINITY_DN55561_c0_g1_i1:137-508(-)